ncbi:MAG: hypothetical protein AB7U79_07235 [Candidatus Izemoplasmatales bacterium]
MRKLIMIFTMLLVIFGIQSCRNYSFEYEGDYSNLYTQALNVIPGTKGFIQSEIRFDPEIDILEYDDNGKILFTYFEGNNISSYSLLVMQYSDENEVCYYSNLNFISSSDNEFSESEIEEIKIDNDWNSEIDNNRIKCSEIARTKQDSPLTYEQIAPLYEYIFPDDEHFPDDRNLDYYISDDYGRVLIVAEARLSDEWVIMLFNSDGTYDSEVGYRTFTDYFTYQDGLIDFLESSPWNEPL